MADPQNGFWLLPSRRRPGNLRQFCDALKNTNTSTAGLILIQRDEFEDMDLAVQYHALELPEKWQIVKTRGESQGDKLRDTVSMYHHCDWVGLIGDDQTPLTKNWDLKIIEWVRGWNLVTCHDDGWQIHEKGPNGILTTPGRICGAPCWSGDLYREVGYIFPPGMHHVYLDDIWEELGKHSGCWNFAQHSRPDVVIAHKHYQRDQVAKDQTYHQAYDYYGSIDFPLWYHWRQQELPNAVERARALKRRCGA